MPFSAFFAFLGTAILVAWWTYAFKRALPKGSRERKGAFTALFAWLVLTAILGLSGVLARLDRMPPPFALYFVSILVTSFAFSFSRWGARLAERLSYAELVGFQAFRIIAELLLFAGLNEGRFPIQMTFEGYNFDIVTGITAIPVALWLARRPSRGVFLAWNIGGLILLTIIVTIAMLSAPLPIRMFMNEPANIMPAYFPYVWLPGILVESALVGHLLSFRKLKRA